MKKGVLILLVLLVLFSLSVSAVEKDCFYYFYGEGDERSEIATAFLNDLESKYEGLGMHKFEVYYNQENLDQLQEFFDAYKVPKVKQGVPAVFLSKSYFIGDQPITEYLENAILSNKDLSCPSLREENVVGLIGEESPKHLIETLTFFTITGAAIADGLDSSALAILLVLITILLTIKKKQKLLKGGIVFIAGVYAAYFLVGTGVLGMFTEGYYFHKIIGVLAVILGSVIAGYSWKGEVFLKKIQGKKKLGEFIKELISPPTVFLISFALSLFGFSSVRKYFAVISGLVIEKMTKLAAMPLLLYYILMFIVPLIAVTWLIYYLVDRIEVHGTDEKVDVRGDIAKWKERKTRLLHLFSGLAMVVLGLIVFF